MLPSAGANVVHFSALDTQALALSTYAFALIFALDKLADADFTDKNTDAFIYTFMGGLGILIGFAWEQAFERSLETVVEAMNAADLHYPEPVLKVRTLTLIPLTLTRTRTRTP